MWTERFDLHSHSTHSDGQHDVAVVASLMAREDVRVWALTDHDTTDGWVNGAKEAKRHNLRFVPGVEITCEPAAQADRAWMEETGRERASSSWHLLALFPNHDPSRSSPEMEAFKAWMEPRQDGRRPRMEAMCRRLGELGMPVSVESVCARATGSVGRPHLAEEMVHLGYVISKTEAFERWIGDGLPGFVAHVKPTVAEAVKAVKGAGGITALAHPLYYGVPTPALMSCLAGLGVDAVEAVHRSHNDAYRHELMEEAQRHGLAVTVGSDFHGLDHQARPGHMPVPIERLAASLRTA
jgi:predicted metal-dependent phosphoesterase TrpH